MRESQTKKIQLTLILGDQEKNDKTISYRLFGNQQTTTVSIEEFDDLINNAIKNKKSNI